MSTAPFFILVCIVAANAAVLHIQHPTNLEPACKGINTPAQCSIYCGTASPTIRIQCNKGATASDVKQLVKEAVRINAEKRKISAELKDIDSAPGMFDDAKTLMSYIEFNRGTFDSTHTRGLTALSMLQVLDATASIQASDFDTLTKLRSLYLANTVFTKFSMSAKAVQQLEHLDMDQYKWDERSEADIIRSLKMTHCNSESKDFRKGIRAKWATMYGPSSQFSGLHNLVDCNKMTRANLGQLPIHNPQIQFSVNDQQ